MLFKPRSAARKAAEYPPGPEPSTSTSQVMSAAPPYALAAAGTEIFDAAGAGAGAAARGADGAATALSASSKAMTDPWETLSPTLTRSSLTTPASEEGISLVALSDSSVMREASFAARSQGFTRTSMTSMSLKSPMSGTFTSIICATPSSQKGAADVGEDRGQIGREARAGRAVDDAVVVGERQRQHQPRSEGAVLVDRPHLRSRHAENRYFGCVDDGRERRTADAAEAGDAEAAAAHAVGLEFFLARGSGDFSQLLRQIENTLAVSVPDHWHQQAVGRIDRDSDVIVLLDDQVLAGLVERGVELRELLQRVYRSFHQGREHGEFEASCFRDLGVLLAERLELGDVGLVVLSDVRDGDPVAMQESAGKLPDSRQRFGFDRAELREIHLRPLRQIQNERAARDDGGDRGRTPHYCLHELLDIRLRDASLRARALDPNKVDAELARELAYRGARVRQRSRGWRRCVGHAFSAANRRRGGDWCRDGCKHRGGLCRVLGFRGGLCWRRRGILCLFKNEDGTALRNLVAGLDSQFLHHAGSRRRNLHRRLVRFHRDQRLLGLHRIARFDQHLDHIDVLEVADVGYEDFPRGFHACSVRD